VPDVAIRTTFITGFPGESEADFAVLSDFVRAAQLDWLGVFSYSDEEGSGAFHLGDKVPARTIDARRRSLMRLQQSISRKSRARLVGRRFDLLVEGPSEETPLLWEGRTQHQAPEIDGKVYINDFGPFDELKPGQFYQCEITESQDYDLVGRII
jgi:ribosomal protein S12 methylthiotransferase